MRVTRRLGRRATAVLAPWGVALVLTVAGAAPALAGSPEETTTPETPHYETSVSVVLTGDAAPPRGRAPANPPPPLCWWEQAGSSAEDPQRFADEFRASATSYGTADMIERQFMQIRGGSAALDRAIEQEETLGDPGVTWYVLRWDSTRFAGENSYQELQDAGCTTVQPWREGSYVPAIYAFFPHGQPEAPQVDVEELARYAYRAMVLVPPGLEWNPKIHESRDAAMVNLPTWLWVSDPLAVAERGIRASIGAVWAQVDATTDAVRVTGGGERVDCSRAEARRSYTLGREEESACTLTFTRASHGQTDGFEMTAETTWSATWTSSTGEGGTFDSRTVRQVTTIPVASTQSIVTQVD